MTFEERLAAIRAGMIEHGLDLLVAVHDGAHFIETPNPVFVLSRFKSLGPAAVVLPRDGEATLIVTPAWDAERAAECCPALRVTASDDVVEALASALGNGGLRGARIGASRSPAAWRSCYQRPARLMTSYSMPPPRRPRTRSPMRARRRVSPSSAMRASSRSRGPA
jgi:hypothetical protein